MFMLIMFIFASLITLVIIAKVWNNTFSKNKLPAERRKGFKYFDEFSFSEKAAYIVPILLLVGFTRSEEHTSELQSRPHLVCRLLLEKKNNRLSIHSCY